MRALPVSPPTVAMFLVMCIAFPMKRSVQAAASPPNILFVLVDDLGWADLGCYGNEFHQTPRIDRLAAEGVRFTDFYAAGAVCSPTRASIQSGQYQARLGITDFIPGHARPWEQLIVPQVRSALPLDVETPAEGLAARGYRTAYFGKWHLGGTGFLPSEQGYQRSLVSSGRHFAPRFQLTPPADVPDGTYLADFLTDATIDFLKADDARPAFVFLSHFAVHIPLEAAGEKIRKYTERTGPAGGINNPVYAAMVEHVDDSVGRLLDALDAAGLAENTVVIVTSDNGGLRQSANGGAIVTSNAPLRDEKGSLYEGGIRVPLIVRWPGVTTAGAICDEPTISVDFWATFADIAGVPVEERPRLDGLSLLPLLRDADARMARESLYWHYPHYHHSRPAAAIRQGRWKLIDFFDDTPSELYDLSADISESDDQAARNPETTTRLSTELQAWLASVDAQMPKPNPDYDPARATLRGPRSRREE
ncbi:MAG: sulfatase [Planctomycetaceae bacterium]